MIDRVDAENRIERAVVERERLTRVWSDETRPPLETGLARKPLSSCHSIIEQLDTNDLASRQLGKGTAGPPDPQATSNSREDAPSLSCRPNRSSSLRVSQLFWPTSSPNAAR